MENAKETLDVGDKKRKSYSEAYTIAAGTTKKRSSVKQMHGMISYIHQLVMETGDFPFNKVFDYLVENLNNKGPPKDKNKWRRTWGDLCRRTEIRYRDLESYNKSDAEIKSLMTLDERKVIEVLEIINNFRGKHEDSLDHNQIVEYYGNDCLEKENLVNIKREPHDRSPDNSWDSYTPEKYQKYIDSEMSNQSVDTIQYSMNSDQAPSSSKRAETQMPEMPAANPISMILSQNQSRYDNHEDTPPTDSERNIYEEFGEFVAKSILNLPNSKLRVLAKHKVLQALMKVEVEALQ